jgi:hypothetical protein
MTWCMGLAVAGAVAAAVVIMAGRPAGPGTAIDVPGLAALNKNGLASVSSVSCASAGNCMAGGDYDERGLHRPAPSWAGVRREPDRTRRVACPPAGIPPEPRPRARHRQQARHQRRPAGMAPGPARAACGNRLGRGTSDRQVSNRSNACTARFSHSGCTSSTAQEAASHSRCAVAGGWVTESSGGTPWYGSISTRVSWPVQPWLRVEEGRSAVSTLGLP